MFIFDPASTSPPVHETIPQILSPPMEMRLEAAVTIIAGMIYSSPQVEIVYTMHQTGDGFRGSAETQVKAAALDITMKYSHDMTRDSHTAAMFLTAVHRAVETVLGKMRRAGVIL